MKYREIFYFLAERKELLCIVGQRDMCLNFAIEKLKKLVLTFDD